MRDIPSSCLPMTIELGSDQNLMIPQVLDKPSNMKARCIGHSTDMLTDTTLKISRRTVFNTGDLI